jgi:hypothetical protein
MKPQDSRNFDGCARTRAHLIPYDQKNLGWTQLLLMGCVSSYRASGGEI